jgi:15-cis-phytoene synthase
MLQLSKNQSQRTLTSVDKSYELCRQITEGYAKTFYLGTQLMPETKRRAIWAIYVWCRRTDELVDGPNASVTTPETLKEWEEHLESIFAGYALDDYDVALVDTIERFPMDIQPFRDMIAGQRMDLYRSRYETFDELNLYCYRVAGTVGLMSNAVMGVDTSKAALRWNWHRDLRSPNEEAIALGVANQLTNILRDVGEDARRGRIYLPLEDLARFNYTEEELFQGIVDDRWRALMKFEITRSRDFYTLAEEGIRILSPDIRWPIWAALMLYRGILDAIEKNDYDVFRKRAYVPKLRKFVCLPIAFLRSKVP